MIFFIPARKGSERVPGKNVRKLCGRWLIEYTFDAAVEACGGDREKVVVSSDDDDVLSKASDYGFRAVLRPADLCTSHAKMNEVIFHHAPDFAGEDVMVLYPTSPFRGAAAVARALSAWESLGGEDKVLMSVERVMHRPYGLMKIDEHTGELNLMVAEGTTYYQSQGQPSLYRANGAIYVIANSLIRTRRLDAQLFGPFTIPHVMGAMESFEVDTETDFEIASAIVVSRKTEARC